MLKVCGRSFKCNTMKDYHNHFIITDILLLADVFENFSKMSLETYGLDLIHYYSLPCDAQVYRCRIGIDNRF